MAWINKAEEVVCIKLRFNPDYIDPPSKWIARALYDSEWLYQSDNKYSDDASEILEVSSANIEFFHYENIGGVCRNLGIKTKDFYKWKKEHPDFPKPSFRHENQPMWLVDDLMKYLKSMGIKYKSYLDFFREKSNDQH